MFSVNRLRKDKNKEKGGGNGPFKKSLNDKGTNMKTFLILSASLRLGIGK